MLVRSAGRKQQRQTSRVLAASFAQLQLPWLAPAQLRWAASQASPAPPSLPEPRRRNLPKSSRASSQLRRLATAADQYPVNYDKHFTPPPSYNGDFGHTPHDQHVPWDMSSSNMFPEPVSTRAASKPIIINTTTVSPGSLVKVQAGVSGSARDLLAHFHTSLSVGRKDRAAAIIQRLSEQQELNAAELSYAHTAYLQELFRTLSLYEKQSDRAQRAYSDVKEWFETEVISKGVLLNGKMLIVMIRAAIQELNDPDQEKSVRRYAEIARSIGSETIDDVLFSEEYSDEEFATVGRVTSDFFESEEDGEQIVDNAHPDSHVAPTSVHAQGPAPPELPSVAEVLPTPQKGLGLSSVKRVMTVFADSPRLPSDASVEARRAHALAKQQQLEHTSIEIALERWRKADEDLRKLGINTAMQNKSISALMWQWYQSLLAALEKELAETKEYLATDGVQETDRHFYGPYLELFSMSSVATNALLFVMSKLASGKDRNSLRYESEVKLSTITLGLAKTLEQDYQAEISRKKSGLAGGLTSSSQSRRRKGLSHGKKTSDKPRDTSAAQDLEAHVEWPMIIKVKLGAMIVAKLLETAELPVTRTHPRSGEKVTQMQPAFLHRARWYAGKKTGVLLPNPALTEKLQSEPVGSLIAKKMPMVVEPKPWKGWKDGGYLHYSNAIMRLQVGDRSGRDYFMAADEKDNLGRVYAGLNALGKVPWMVNPDVFRVQLEAWNTGEALANFAPLHPQFDIPPEPESTADPNVKKSWLREVRGIEDKKIGLHSKRCFQNFQMEVARSFLDETLYLPHSLDFRGRAYPIPPYLNHMGADNVRGLLVFAEGKALGPNGLRWLKIHLATVAGRDKASLEERVEYTMSHLDDIYDSVQNPLEGRRWWLQSEDAWQTLAACFELTKALDSPDPTQFISHIPIQQDGTCNGLQHYAALGGDRAGAAQVNLEPGERPSDVYTAVAEAVKREICEDAANGNEVARKLDGHLTRKCVKQPVMTNVYGVTYYGARMQVKRQLEAIFPNVKRTDAVNHDDMARYVAEKIFKSLGTMFSGAQAIQKWLGQCADRITTCLTPEQIEEYVLKGGPDKLKKRISRKPDKKSAESARVVRAPSSKEAMQLKAMFRSTVVWTTPLGLPVVQPYRSTKSQSISTDLQHVSLADPQVWDPVSRRKQLQAFPPNFIHSLDSSHMLLSATKCSELGVTFASIHDSFWTHACDVDTMSSVLRDAFVAMHGEDIIGRLREEFQARYKGAMYMASVRADSLAAQEIKQLRKSMKAELSNGGELRLEVERLRLLGSEDAEERAKGRKMITPASVFAIAAESESSFAAPLPMLGQGLGEMPAPTDDDVVARKTHNADVEEFGFVPDNEPPAGSESADDVDELAAGGGDDKQTTRTSSKPETKASLYKRQYVWLPIEFPEVPEKGDFDVKRLRESKYFFH